MHKVLIVSSTIGACVYLFSKYIKKTESNILFIEHFAVSDLILISSDKIAQLWLLLNNQKNLNALQIIIKQILIFLEGLNIQNGSKVIGN